MRGAELPRASLGRLLLDGRPKVDFGARRRVSQPNGL